MDIVVIALKYFACFDTLFMIIGRYRYINIPLAIIPVEKYVLVKLSDPVFVPLLHSDYVPGVVFVNATP